MNAKFHEKEAHIIAEAGRPGAVTIATNMAGRGTDIVLGGSKESDGWQQRHAEVIAAGGLRIIGSERHESRRIDNQLRGRSGRQGDPGSTRFYLSLDDNLMRIFASDRVTGWMKKLGMKPGEPIEHSLITKSIENAQRKLEGHHFDVRKQLLEYDNVANEQRKVIYTQRANIMDIEDPNEYITNMRKEVVASLVNTYIPNDSLEEQWDIDGLTMTLADDFHLSMPIKNWLEEDHALEAGEIKTRVEKKFIAVLEEKEKQAGLDVLNQFQRSVLLQTVDNQWREHLSFHRSSKTGDPLTRLRTKRSQARV